MQLHFGAVDDGVRGQAGQVEADQEEADIRENPLCIMPVFHFQEGKRRVREVVIGKFSRQGYIRGGRQAHADTSEAGALRPHFVQARSVGVQGEKTHQENTTEQKFDLHRSLLTGQNPRPPFQVQILIQTLEVSKTFRDCLKTFFNHR